LKPTLRGLLLAVLGSVALSGCASYDLIKPAPAESQPIEIAYSSEGPSGWSDLPIGAYRLPNSQVIVSGYQGGGVGFAFGLIGLAVQDEVETNTGKGKVEGAQAALHVNLAAQAQDVTTSLIKSGQFGNAFSTGPTGGPLLTVTPYIVITYMNDTDVRPFLILKTSLRSSGAGRSGWTSRYIASEGSPLPLTGEHSYAADSGSLLNATLSKELEAGIKFMLTDIASPKSRDSGKLVYVETSVPFVKQRFALVGSELGEDDHWLAFVPRVADANVFAGVHIVDKSVTVYRDAASSDKIRALDNK
jgi:hypothetical protein